MTWPIAFNPSSSLMASILPQFRGSRQSRKCERFCTLSLDRRHLTLQAAFGWTNSHLFEFHAGEERWGIPDPDGDFGPPPIDARKARLCDIIQEPAPRRSITSMTSATVGTM